MEDHDSHPESLDEIKGLGQYLSVFGATLGRKANASLQPMHIPETSPLPDFSGYGREPYPAQAHIATANAKLLTSRFAGIISGECGTGKTIVSILAIDQAARQSRRKGGKGGNYIAAVVCPDHLIKKWCREIGSTIPGAIVRRFGKDDENGDDTTPKKAWADFLNFMDEYNVVRRMAGGHTYEVRRGAHWSKPSGANWFVFGRNQIKWYSDKRSLGEQARCFDGKLRKGRPRRVFETGSTPIKDEAGNVEYEPNGYMPKTKKIYEKLPVCPKCGSRLTDDRGNPLSWGMMHKRNARLYTCPARYLEELVSVDAQGNQMIEGEGGRDKMPVIGEFRSSPPGKEVKVGNRTYVVRECGEPLWQFTGKPWRWSIARLVQRRMKGFFDYLICDEVHEHKDPRAIQSVAFGKMLAASRHAMALTGTLINGYADSLFALLMRVDGRNIQQRGFAWEDGREAGGFTEEYGRIDTILTSKAPLETISKKGTGRKMDVGKVNTRRARAPGVMPTLFGHILAPVTTFLTLEELADELPDLTEVLDEGCVDLPDDILAEYHRIENILVREARKLLAKGSMKLLGTMLQTLLAYADHPFDWSPMFEGEHTIGYWINPVADHPELMKKENWHGVVSPWNFDLSRRVLPKERKLIDIVKRGKEKGEQTWIYIQMTKKHNVMPRLQSLLENAGLKAGVLNDYDADPTQREDWIRANGDKYDCIMSYPKLVSTGLDLFWRDDMNSPYAFNYNNLVFYQTGYNLFDLRQASRRSWRLGQDRDCTVYYLYCCDTMQHRAMELMSRKLEAALQIEGEFSEDGLAALSSDGSMQMELCKKLSGSIDENDLGRKWAKVKAGGKRKYKTWEEQAQEQEEDDKQEPEAKEEELFVVPPGCFIMKHPRLGDFLCTLIHADPEAYIEASDFRTETKRPSVMITHHDLTRDRWSLDVDSVDIDQFIELTKALRNAGFLFGQGGEPAESRDVSPKHHRAGEVPFETGVPKPDEWSDFDDQPMANALVAETIIAHAPTMDDWGEFESDTEDEGGFGDWDNDDDPDDITGVADLSQDEPEESDDLDWGEYQVPEDAEQRCKEDQAEAVKRPTRAGLAAMLNAAMAKAQEEADDEWDF